MDISIKDLEAYRANKEKLFFLEKELEWLYKPISSPQGRETIGFRGGGSPSDPTASAVAKIEAQRAKIESHKMDLLDQIARIEDWVMTLTDVDLMRIIQAHYMDGLTWRETTKIVYGYYDKDTSRVRVMRYFGKHVSE